VRIGASKGLRAFNVVIVLDREILMLSITIIECCYHPRS
jgi:hypothetical protein